MAELVAGELRCPAEQVLVASTGVIGRPLPMLALEAGIPKATRDAAAGRDAFSDAAHAILTTDTGIKVSSRVLELGSGAVTVTGFAKGAAMIGPNMATMLALVFTDATVWPASLSPRSHWYQEALLMQGSAAALLRDPDQADLLLAAAAQAAQSIGCTETQMLAASQQSLLR